MDRPGNNAAAHITENVLWFDGAFEKNLSISTMRSKCSTVCNDVLCYYYQSYLASLCTSSLLLMPPVGLKSTLKHLSNWSGSMRGCNTRTMIRMSSRNTATKNIQAHFKQCNEEPQYQNIHKDFIIDSI